MGYITEKGAEGLKNYKYKSGGYSYLDNKMNDWWLFCVELLPMWMAPNLVTFIGFFFMLSCEAVFLQFDKNFKSDIPSWAFYWSALAHFIYQTLDAIDGKQARRTKASSPLGQLFDHGCDTFSLIIIINSTCRAFHFDATHSMLFLVFCQISFTGGNWKEYHTGVLLTHIGNFGVTETQIICMLFYIISGVFGYQVYQIPLKNIIGDIIPGVPKDIQVIHAFFYVMFALNGVCNSFLFMHTFSVCKQKLYALAQLIPNVSIMFFEILWIQTKFFDDYAAYVMILFATIFSGVQVKMIICSVAHQRFEIFHFPVLLLGILTVYFRLFENEFPELNFKIFVGCFIVMQLYQLKFLVDVINEIKEILGIYCLTLKRRKDD